VDILDGTGNPAIPDEVAAVLTAAGLTVGSVTSGDSTASGIEYPDGEQAGAQWLADALDTADLLRAGGVPHVTVVLGSTDSAALVRAIAALPACDAGE
jgi:hypothetical protein